MARGISLVNADWQDVRRLLGETYQGKIVVSKVWLQSVTAGTEEYTMVRTDSLGEHQGVVIAGETVNTPNTPPKKATFSIDE